jgi:hypothetical protein
MCKWEYTQVDNQWVSVPHSKNHPTLVVTTMYADMYHWQVGQLKCSGVTIKTAMFLHQVCGDLIRVLKNLPFSLISSQIWLNPLVDDCMARQYVYLLVCMVSVTHTFGPFIL